MWSRVGLLKGIRRIVLWNSEVAVHEIRLTDSEGSPAAEFEGMIWNNDTRTSDWKDSDMLKIRGRRGRKGGCDIMFDGMKSGISGDVDERELAYYELSKKSGRFEATELTSITVSTTSDFSENIDELSWVWNGLEIKLVS